MAQVQQFGACLLRVLDETFAGRVQSKTELYDRLFNWSLSL